MLEKIVLLLSVWWMGGAIGFLVALWCLRGHQIHICISPKRLDFATALREAQP